MRGTEVRIGSLEAIPPGEGRNFELAGKRIAVFRTRANTVYAVQPECPHRGGPLADGLVGGTTVICPLHAWKFDLSTGAPLLGECALTTYPVRVDEHGQILLSLEPATLADDSGARPQRSDVAAAT
jgi:nitrite reductase (NADH) small subunit